MARREPRVLAVGDAIVDRITPPMGVPPRGDFQGQVEAFYVLPGGNATNFALQMARLGLPTTFVGSIGGDADGRFLQEIYRRHGVRAVVRTDPRRPTGTTVALSWIGGGRALITSLGANDGLRQKDVAPALVGRHDHVHRAGFWWTPRMMGQPTARLLAGAKRAGAETSLDVSTDPMGWTQERLRAVRCCLPFVDTFFGNEKEVRALGGDRTSADAARQICDLGAKEVVIHRGARGSTSVTPDKAIRAPAFRVPEENPTGCGDVFNAGYVYARLQGNFVLDALRFGNACSALHLRDRRRPYARTSEVRAFLASRFTGS